MDNRAKLSSLGRSWEQNQNSKGWAPKSNKLFLIVRRINCQNFRENQYRPTDFFKILLTGRMNDKFQAFDNLCFAKIKACVI